MKVLWITNIPIAKHLDILKVGKGQSGGWMEAAYTALRDSKDITLGVVTVHKCSSIMRDRDLQHTFYVIPHNKPLIEYDYTSAFNIALWQQVVDEFQPDIIQLWGTEFSHGLCALKVAKNIPCVVYIQGMMSQIYNHSEASISLVDRIKYTTTKDVFLGTTFWHTINKYKSQAQIEKCILEHAQAVIVENDWCADNCIAVSSQLRVYKSLLPINSLFAKYDWDIHRIQPHTIFTTAGAAPIKGHHQLLKALAIVAKQFPDVKLLIPGDNFYFQKGFLRDIKRNSFPRYLLALIKKMEIENNVKFVGKLTPIQMAEHMQSCHAFAMPSAIENHSSTLIEAMIVGAPCVSSYVGGVAEYLENGVNGFICRYDEPEVMAANIIKIFRDDELAVRLSHNSKQSMRKHRLSMNLKADFVSIYNNMIQNNG